MGGYTKADKRANNSAQLAARPPDHCKANHLTYATGIRPSITPHRFITQSYFPIKGVFNGRVDRWLRCSAVATRLPESHLSAASFNQLLAIFCCDLPRKRKQ